MAQLHRWDLFAKDGASRTKYVRVQTPGLVSGELDILYWRGRKKGNMARYDWNGISMAG